MSPPFLASAAVRFPIATPPDVPGLPPAAQTATSQIAFWMMEEGMVDLGLIVVLGNVPYIKCGHGDDCPMTGVQMLYGPEATVASVGVHRLEGDAALLNQAREMGESIRQAVTNSA